MVVGIGKHNQLVDVVQCNVVLEQRIETNRLAHGNGMGGWIAEEEEEEGVNILNRGHGSCSMVECIVIG